MAKTNFQDPGSSEIRSTHISGVMEAINKIEESLNMDTVAETDVVLPELFISEDDRYRIFQAPEGKRNWLNSPAPVIKKNGVEISTGFGIDYGGGAVVFNPPLTASDTVTASFTRTKNTSGFNAHLADKVHIGNNPYCKVSHSVNQSISNAVDVVISFDSIIDDNDSIYDSLNPSRLVCKTAGIYLINASATFASNATGFRVIRIRKNGAVIAQSTYVPISSTTAMLAVTVARLNVNDYIEIVVYQNSGGSLDIIASPTFSIVRVR